MKKWNKRLTLLLALMLIMGILVGCSNSNISKKIENKKFAKDVGKIYELTLDSAEDKKYYEDDINKVLNKMNEGKYLNKLNQYELSIFNSLKNVLGDVEDDLTTGKKIIQSTTLDEVILIKKMLED